MSMSKQDFIALADLLRSARPRHDNPDDAFGPTLVYWHHLIERLATFCKSQNPAFKRERWLAYIAGECGPNGGAIKK